MFIPHEDAALLCAREDSSLTAMQEYFYFKKIKPEKESERKQARYWDGEVGVEEGDLVKTRPGEREGGKERWREIGVKKKRIRGRKIGRGSLCVCVQLFYFLNL